MNPAALKLADMVQTYVFNKTHVWVDKDPLNNVIADALAQAQKHGETVGYNRCAEKWSKEIERLKSIGYIKELAQARLEGARAMQEAAQEAMRNNFGAGVFRANDIIRALDPQQVINESVK
jgi:hypothetical protein